MICYYLNNYDDDDDDDIIHKNNNNNITIINLSIYKALIKQCNKNGARAGIIRDFTARFK